MAHQLSLREEGDAPVKKVFSHLTLGQALECGMPAEDWRRNRAADALATEGLQQHGNWKPLAARLKLRKRIMQQLQLLMVEMVKLRTALLEGKVKEHVDTLQDKVGDPVPAPESDSPKPQAAKQGERQAAATNRSEPLAVQYPSCRHLQWARWMRGPPQRGRDWRRYMPHTEQFWRSRQWQAGGNGTTWAELACAFEIHTGVAIGARKKFTGETNYHGDPPLLGRATVVQQWTRGWRKVGGTWPFPGDAIITCASLSALGYPRTGGLNCTMKRTGVELEEHRRIFRPRDMKGNGKDKTAFIVTSQRGPELFWHRLGGRSWLSKISPRYLSVRQ